MAKYLESQSVEGLGIYFSSKHKCGTSLIKTIVRQTIKGIPQPFHLFGIGNLDIDKIGKKNYCYVMDMEFGRNLIASKHRKRTVFQYRDPRDILVSEYYSYGWTHTAPTLSTHTQEQIDGFTRQRSQINQMNLDDYVLSGYSKQLLSYFEKLMFYYDFPVAGDTFVSYETMVLNFRGWLEQIIAPFDFVNPSRVIDQLDYQWAHEIVPPSTDQWKHKRHVTPGDHRWKLKPQTIIKMNKTWAHVLNHPLFQSKDYDYA